jgi:hypothetical protein
MERNPQCIFVILDCSHCGRCTTAHQPTGWAARSECTTEQTATEFFNIRDPPEDPTCNAESPVGTFTATPDSRADPSQPITFKAQPLNAGHCEGTIDKTASTEGHTSPFSLNDIRANPSQPITFKANSNAGHSEVITDKAACTEGNTTRTKKQRQRARKQEAKAASLESENEFFRLLADSFKMPDFTSAFCKDLFETDFSDLFETTPCGDVLNEEDDTEADTIPDQHAAIAESRLPQDADSFMTIDASRDIGFAALSKRTAVPIATEFFNIGDPPEGPTRSADSPVVTFKATPATRADPSQPITFKAQPTNAGHREVIIDKAASTEGHTSPLLHMEDDTEVDTIPAQHSANAETLLPQDADGFVTTDTSNDILIIDKESTVPPVSRRGKARPHGIKGDASEPSQYEVAQALNVKLRQQLRDKGLDHLI